MASFQLNKKTIKDVKVNGMSCSQVKFGGVTVYAGTAWLGKFLTEDGDALLTEDGDNLIILSRPKD